MRTQNTLSDRSKNFHETANLLDNIRAELKFAESELVLGINNELYRTDDPVQRQKAVNQLLMQYHEKTSELAGKLAETAAGLRETPAEYREADVQYPDEPPELLPGRYRFSQAFVEVTKDDDLIILRGSLIRAVRDPDSKTTRARLAEIAEISDIEQMRSKEYFRLREDYLLPGKGLSTLCTLVCGYTTNYRKHYERFRQYR